jgi:putative polyribitolphosphotransferase
MKIVQKIDEENRLWIEVSKKAILKENMGKPSLKLYFKSGIQDRLFPLETSFEENKSGEYVLVGRNTILLPYVFLNEAGDEKVEVRVELFQGGSRKAIGEPFYLDSKYFVKPQMNVTGRFAEIRWIVALLLLPVAVITSFLAGNKGRNALKKANQHIKRWTGISFSLREFKTDYLKKQYEKSLSLPVKTNNVLFLSERKVEKGGNLALVYDELKNNKNLIITSFLKTKTVDRLSFKELRESARLMAEAGCIVLEDFYPQLHALDLRKETKVIQLWHACGAFKAFGFSRLHKPGGPEEESKNHRNYDKVFVSGEKMIPYYSEAFAIPEENVLPLGTPRTDIFFDEAYKEQIFAELFNQFPVFRGKRRILFAPTFRGQGNKDAYYPDSSFSVETFMKDMPEDVILIIKQHPFVKNTINIPQEYKDRVFDLSKKISINDLLFVTDVLITDYSSSVFEAALLDIPMVFYVFDEDSYRKDRDFYEDFDSFIPGLKAENQDELKKQTLICLDNEKALTYDTTEFKETFLSAIDGNSTKRITEYLIDLIEED